MWESSKNIKKLDTEEYHSATEAVWPGNKFATSWLCNQCPDHIHVCIMCAERYILWYVCFVGMKGKFILATVFYTMHLFYLYQFRVRATLCQPHPQAPPTVAQEERWPGIWHHMFYTVCNERSWSKPQLTFQIIPPIHNLEISCWIPAVPR